MVGFHGHLKAYADGVAAILREHGYRASVCEDFGSDKDGEVFYLQTRLKSGTRVEFVFTGQNVRLRHHAPLYKSGGLTTATFEYADPNFVESILGELGYAGPDEDC